MRPRLIIAIALGAVALFSMGCSSVISRSHPRDAKLYPGVRYSSREFGASSLDDPLGGLLTFCSFTDLLLSAGVDTVLLPVDLAYHPSEVTSLGPQYTNGVFRGVYRSGFEVSEFTLIGSRERWWLDSLTRRVVLPGPDKPGHPVLLVVQGELSERGHYGHLGRYPRELRVTQVLEFQQIPAEER